MRRLIPYLILLIGLSLTMTSMLVVAQEGGEEDDVVIDEPPPPMEYIGSRECRDCHRDYTTAHAGTAHALTMVEIEEDMDPEDNPVIADFDAGENARTVTFPDGETRAFTLADVAFNLGAGRNRQAFIYQAEVGEDEDDVYYVLPAEWNVNEGIWQAVELAETWPDEAYAFGPNCAGCHTVGVDTSDYDWEEEGVLCETCHGPGLEHVELADDAGGTIDEEERAGINASINLGFSPDTCGQCHVRGLAEDGIHPYPVNFYPQIHDLADFYTPVSTDDDTHWWPSGHARLPNMQHNEWLISGHPNALASAQESDNFSAECLTCHSTVQQLVDLRLSDEDIDPATVDPLALAEANNFGITCASCHNPHMIIDDDDENAEPMVAHPASLREESYTLCVSCHSDNDVTDGIHYPVREVFEGVPLIEDIEVTASPHFTAEDGPTCSTCHMQALETYNGERASHASAIVPPGSAIDVDGLQDSCSGCHDEGQAQLQQLIDDIQTDTLDRIATARSQITDTTSDWVSTALDVIESEGSAGIHNYTYTDTLLDFIELELGE